MSDQFEIALIACMVSSACVLPGVFLVLRRVALMSDAISHAILLGIVAMFFWTKNLHSLWLMAGATGAGILTVMLTEALINSRKLKKDAAIGLVFPLFFSLGVLGITMFAGNIHIDTDAVLLGEIAFAPFNRLVINGIDIGPMAMWMIGITLVVNASLVTLFYKELKLMTFDSALGKALGFSQALIHYGLMTMVSITAVAAFDAVGSILVVALMITPAATAYLLTQRLPVMIGIGLAVGILASLLGYTAAYFLDASIAGCIAATTGIMFILALIFSPHHGLLMKFLLKQHQKQEFAAKMLVVQLLSHENTSIEDQENTVDHLEKHMNWHPEFAKKITQYALNERLVINSNGLLKLTELGRETAKAALRM